MYGPTITTSIQPELIHNEIEENIAKILINNELFMNLLLLRGGLAFTLD